MEQSIAALAWPGAVVILGCLVLILFRAQISALIGRTMKVGKSGIEIFEHQLAQPTDEKKGIDEFLRGFDNAFLLEAEQLILKNMEDRKIKDPANREKALVRSYASNKILLLFERAYVALWASQLTSLRYLNLFDQGTELTEIVTFYEDAKAKYPIWYENYSFERWLEFLRSYNLVGRRNAHVFITVAGREFLKYLAAAGKTDPYEG